MPRRATLRTLDQVIDGADLFLGLSGPGRPDRRDGAADGARTRSSSRSPTPTPRSTRPRRARPTPTRSSPPGGRDYPNQVNNVLCFPFIFRGALDVGATEINDAMQIACVEGIAALARASSSAEAAAAYQGERLSFGRDYLIPKAFDPRLLAIVAGAVAQAAMETGVAPAPGGRHRGLQGRSSTSRSSARPSSCAGSSTSPHSGGRRIVFAEGEDERVLHAAFAMTEERVGRPILIGRPDVIEARCERAAIPLKVGRDFELVNPENDPRYREYWGTYHAIMQRRGVTPDLARAIMRTNTTAIGAVMVHRGEADSLICGTFGQYLWHLNYVRQVLGAARASARSVRCR